MMSEKGTQQQKREREKENEKTRVEIVFGKNEMERISRLNWKIKLATENLNDMEY